MPVLPTFTFFSEIEREIVPTIPITTQTYLYEEYHTQVTYQPNKEETQRKHINKRYEKFVFCQKKKLVQKSNFFPFFTVLEMKPKKGMKNLTTYMKRHKTSG